MKLLGTDDQQIKCCSSPPPSSRQVLVNPVLSHLSTNVLLLVQTRSCLYNQYIKHTGRNLANVKALQVGWKCNNG